jgi:hypothetical protein
MNVVSSDLLVVDQGLRVRHAKIGETVKCGSEGDESNSGQNRNGEEISGLQGVLSVDITSFRSRVVDFVRILVVPGISEDQPLERQEWVLADVFVRIAGIARLQSVVGLLEPFNADELGVLA